MTHFTSVTVKVSMMDVTTSRIIKHIAVGLVTCVIFTKYYSSLRGEFRVQFPVLPDFLRSSEFGTGSTQPREYK
jgi:hypothetical protein